MKLSRSVPLSSVLWFLLWRCPHRRGRVQGCRPRTCKFLVVRVLPSMDQWNPQYQGQGTPSIEMSAVAPVVAAALQMTPSPEMDSALPETLKRPKSGEPQRRSPSLDMPRASRRSAVRRSPSLEMPRTTRSALLRPREVPLARGSVLRASSPERFALLPRGAVLRSASPERVCTMQGPEGNVKALCDCSAILCLGDSLTAGYVDGIAPDVPYTDRLAQRLRKMGGSPVITNAGISGEKSSQMTLRLAGLLHQGLKYDAVVIMVSFVWVQCALFQVLLPSVPRQESKEQHDIHSYSWAQPELSNVDELCGMASFFFEERRPVVKACTRSFSFLFFCWCF